MLKSLRTLLAAALLSCVAYTSLANDKVTIVVGYPPGGDTDVLARLISEKYSELIGKPVVVENRVGASGAIATNYVKDAMPDGSVLLFTPSTHVTAPLVTKGLSYNPVSDVTPILQLSGHGLFLVVTKDSGVTSLTSLMQAYAKGQVYTYATAGEGTPMHIVGQAFSKASGANLIHVPFRGNSAVVTALLGNHVPMTVITLLPVIPYVDTGRLTLLATTGPTRSAFYPNVPTLKELGLKDMSFNSWLGFVGPRDMSAETANRINTDLNKVLRLPDVQTKLKALAMEPKGGTPEDFAATIKTDLYKYKTLVESLRK